MPKDEAVEERTVNKYNAKATCPKCGCREVHSHYVAKRDYVPYMDQDREMREHVLRRCIRCSFAWAEKCLHEGDCRGSQD